MTNRTLSTDDVAPNDRLSYWRDVVCDTFVELDCESARREAFFGSLTNTSLLDIQFTGVRSAPQHVVRTRSKIASSDHDFLLLSLQAEGRGQVAQDGRTAVLAPGDFALYDTTRPYDLTFNESFHQLVLRLPREVVSSRLADTHAITATTIKGDQGVGRLASSFIQQLHSQLTDIDPLSAHRLHASAVDLLVTALAAQQGATPAVTSQSQNLMRQRIRSFIDTELGNPDLNCEYIAARHGISERYLRKLFAASEVGLSEWIWRRRLDQAKRDLLDPLHGHVSITTIGYDVGFKDSAHFSRAFKSRFGVTPRDLRGGKGPP